MQIYMRPFSPILTLKNDRKCPSHLHFAGYQSRSCQIAKSHLETAEYCILVQMLFNLPRSPERDFRLQL